MIDKENLSLRHRGHDGGSIAGKAENLFRLGSQQSKRIFIRQLGSGRAKNISGVKGRGHSFRWNR